MRNRIILILIIIAAIFPFAATVVELAQNQLAALALVVLTLVAIAIPVGAMFYRPKRSPDADVPVQLIPTIKQPARQDGSPKGAATRNAPVTSDSTVKPAAAKQPADTKNQRAR